MSYQFGKAVFGGKPVSEDAVRDLEVERLQAMWRQLRRPTPSDDPLDQRLGEELAYAQRLLALAEAELKRRGLATVLREVEEADAVIGDVAGVVEAKDPCEGVARASAPVKRRLLRGGGESICGRDGG